MMFLDLVSELEKKHDIFDKHCYDNRQVYSLKSIADLQQAQQPKSDVVYFTYDLSTLHNRKLPRNLIFCGESSFISEQLIPNTIQMPEKEMSIFLEDAEDYSIPTINCRTFIFKCSMRSCAAKGSVPCWKMWAMH